MDADNKTVYEPTGIVVAKENNSWSYLCVDSANEASLAAKVCDHLGLHNYNYYQLYRNKVQPVPIDLGHINKMTQTLISNNISTGSCNLLFVNCSTHYIIKPPVYTVKEDYVAHWDAAIYFDGYLKCLGIILTKDWILSTSSCIGTKTKYVCQSVMVFIKMFI